MSVQNSPNLPPFPVSEAALNLLRQDGQLTEFAWELYTLHCARGDALPFTVGRIASEVTFAPDESSLARETRVCRAVHALVAVGVLAPATGVDAKMMVGRDAVQLYQFALPPIASDISELAS
jgi:hypothetical protein